MQDADIDIDHFIFQTYTYSFENHLCHADGFNNTCKASSQFANTVYDYTEFAKEFSNIIYELFIWHVSLCKKNPLDFEKDEFLRLLDLGNFNFPKQTEFLTYLSSRASSKIQSLKATHPNFDLDVQKDFYRNLGVQEDNVYLYIRGHSLYALYKKVVIGVCDKILNIEKDKLAGNSILIQQLYQNRKKADEVVKNNILFSQYPEIVKIEEDIKIYMTF